jgi:NADPH-dependent 2,4-dienoyl-CoA reductase/sulfur reductase-like enzyme
VEEFATSMDRPGLTRREVVAAGAIAGAGALAGPGVADAARRRRRPVRRHVDVVIVGAGFAGLTAARELVRDDRSVVVLEARNRVGRPRAEQADPRQRALRGGRDIRGADPEPHPQARRGDGLGDLRTQPAAAH